MDVLHYFFSHTHLAKTLVSLKVWHGDTLDVGYKAISTGVSEGES